MQLQILNRGPFGVNCYLLSHDGSAIVIDPGVPGREIQAALQAQGLTLCAVLLTHGHVDHLAFADDLLQAPLYVHAADLPALSDPARNVSPLFGFALTVQKTACTVEDGQILKLAGLEVEVIHTPGHTPGGVCYRIGLDIFCGDTIFASGRGRTDLPGGSDAELMRSIAHLLTRYPDAVLHPGHGSGTTCARERSIYLK